MSGKLAPPVREIAGSHNPVNLERYSDQQGRRREASSFPEASGLTPRNLEYKRYFVVAWSDWEIMQEVLAQITSRLYSIMARPRNSAAACCTNFDGAEPGRCEIIGDNQVREAALLTAMIKRNFEELRI